MNLIRLNLETLLTVGVLVNPYKINCGKNYSLCAVVGYKRRLKDRGLRGYQVHWLWQAYRITTLRDWNYIATAISDGIYIRVAFITIRNEQKNLYYPTRTIFSAVGSLDADESGLELLYKLKDNIHEYTFSQTT